MFPGRRKASLSIKMTMRENFRGNPRVFLEKPRRLAPGNAESPPLFIAPLRRDALLSCG
jgi:hypothetical protein